MVTNYDLDKSNYKIYSLKGTVFLFNDDLLRSISIDGDTTHISLSGKPLTVRCDTVQVSEESSLAGRSVADTLFSTRLRMRYSFSSSSC